MKKFFLLASKSGFGTGVAVYFYSLLTRFFAGRIDLVASLVPSVCVAVVFGTIYATVHMFARPTLHSSLITAGAFVACAIGVSLYAGTFAGASVGSLAAIACLSLSIGAGAYAGIRTGRPECCSQ
jgi:hypothetical protein